VGRIYIILQEKKGATGGVNTNRSRSHPPQPPMQQSSDACQAEYESFAFGFSANTAEILNANRSHLHDTAITRISDTNDSHLHLI